jgi:hypothetical protein
MFWILWFVVILWIVYTTQCITRDIDEIHIEGYRKPGTHEGDWQGAWVYLPRKDGSATCILFEDMEDFITRLQPNHGRVLVDQRKGLLDKGWQPMTRKDIWKTIYSEIY